MAYAPYVTTEALENVRLARILILRALEALESGAMQVNIMYNAGVLTAEVTSTVVQGKKHPVEKTETYTTILTPTRFECSCKDFYYRGALCKHVLSAAIVAQSWEAEEQKQAA